MDGTEAKYIGPGRTSHYENMPMQDTEIFKVVKNKNFQWKILIFFLFLLKT